MTRKKRLLYNIIFSLADEIALVVCGFILPRLFLTYYGSATNGLIASISNLLGFISLCQCGIGPVVQSSLYKPLAEKDNELISSVVCASQNFYRKIAYLLFVYVVGLMIFYPYLVQDKFNYLYVVVLIFALSVSSFAEYYFGISYSLLLGADQRNYICNGIHIFCLLLNTFVCTILIKRGISVQFVKIIASGIFLIKPIFLLLFVRKNYLLVSNAKFDGNTIQQKWNGLSQHVDYIVCTGLPLLSLSLFSSFENVSIFAIYFIVVGGLINLLQVVFKNFTPLFGDLFARRDERILKLFSSYECFVHVVSSFVFSITAVLIVPFISIYTEGVNDINYNLPLFGWCMVLMAMSRLIRRPYKDMILAFGEYKNTEKMFYLGTVINIIITIISVLKYGLIGSTFGTIFVLFVEAFYIERKTIGVFFGRSYISFVKYLLTDVAIFCAVSIFTQDIYLFNQSYLAWVIMALKVTLITIILIGFILSVFCRNELMYCYKILFRHQ